MAGLICHRVDYDRDVFVAGLIADEKTRGVQMGWEVAERGVDHSPRKAIRIVQYVKSNYFQHPNTFSFRSIGAGEPY